MLKKIFRSTHSAFHCTTCPAVHYNFFLLPETLEGNKKKIFISIAARQDVLFVYTLIFYELLHTLVSNNYFYDLYV